MSVRSPLHQRTVGAGPAVVFLHSSRMDGRVWSPVVDALPDLAAIVVDRPGHGGSVDRIALQRAAESVRSADDYAAYVVSLRVSDNEPDRVEETVAVALADVANGSATIVGHGDGGLLALDLAARGHLRVGAVVTVDAPVLPPPADVDLDAVLAVLEERDIDLDAQRAELDRALGSRDADADADAESILAQYDLSSSGPEAEIIRAMVRDNAFPALLTAPSRPPGSVDLEMVDVPVLVVHASSAPPAPGELERAMPRARISSVTVPDTPSTLALAAPADLARVIRTAVHTRR